MPTIHVSIDNFNKLLGKTLTIKEIDDLCFQFGIEFEEVDVVEKEEEKKEEKAADKKKKKKKEAKKEYSFEVAANRPDLLSIEGLTIALGVYLGLKSVPNYKVVNPEIRQKIVVKKDTKLIRPFVVGAVLRNFTFDQSRYDSFIDMQDKLHHNLCRRRRLVAIGTHDLDTIQGPFRYDALPGKQIEFIPLNKNQKMDAVSMLQMYETDSHLKDFVPIIKDSPVYPVIFDSKDRVLSLPPIINGDHSKINLNTKNIFIECTATDYTKATVTLNTILSSFSCYTSEPFNVESVEVLYEETGETKITPDFTTHTFNTTVDYVNKLGTLQISVDEMIKCCQKMMLDAKKVDDLSFEVTAPISRSDVLQQCDIAEDICIAYGYNKIEKKLPRSFTVGKQFFINKFSDIIREEMAHCGYQEGQNFILTSMADLTTKIQKEADELVCTIDNYKTLEFSVGRTTLIPGLLTWLQHNRQAKIPLRLFEVGDVMLRAPDHEVGSVNQRRLAVVYTNQHSDFELIHGVLDLIMLKMKVKKGNGEGRSYTLIAANDTTFFPGRSAHIKYNGNNIGIMGIVHPKVGANYEWKYPISLVELNLEPLFKDFED